MKNLIFNVVILSFLILSGCSTSSDYTRGTFIPTNSEPVSIPFTRISKLIIIEAKINGVQGKFLFDNGFSMSAINADFAKKANITFSGSSNIRDANSKRKKVKEATVKAVEINGQQFVNTGFYLINTKKFLPCDDIDGVIGASIINKANWKIDFQNLDIKISSKPFIEEGFRLNNYFNRTNTTHANVKINNIDINVMIDLGSTNSLKLSKKKYQNSFKGAQVEKKYGILSLSTTGLGNIQLSYLTSKQYKIEQGNNQLPLMSTILFRGNNKYPGYLGVDYFDEFNVIINSTENEYILSPNSIIEKTEQREQSYGVVIYQIDSNWIIMQKDLNNSRLNNLKIMDVVQRLDSDDMSRFKDNCSLKEYLKQKSGRKEALQITVNKTTYYLPYKENDLSVLE